MADTTLATAWPVILVAVLGQLGTFAVVALNAGQARKSAADQRRHELELRQAEWAHEGARTRGELRRSAYVSLLNSADALGYTYTTFDVSAAAAAVGMNEAPPDSPFAKSIVEARTVHLAAQTVALLGGAEVVTAATRLAHHLTTPLLFKGTKGEWSVEVYHRRKAFLEAARKDLGIDEVTTLVPAPDLTPPATMT